MDPEHSHAEKNAQQYYQMIDRVMASIGRFRKANPDYTGPIPAGLVTAFGNGLDPDISLASAIAQTSRVAKARAVTENELEQVIAHLTEAQVFGFWLNPR